jgi:hypothetical protein
VRLSFFHKRDQTNGSCHPFQRRIMQSPRSGSVQQAASLNGLTPASALIVLHKMDIATQIEEADVGLCADGFDNFVMYGELDELRQHSANLKTVGAKKCAKVIDEFLAWLDSEPDLEPLDVLEADPARTNDLWARYNESSCEESPLDLAKRKSPPKKQKMPITDREHYDFYGEEDSNRPCKVAECDRGSVKFSVHCRTHHFENVMRKPCPWND